MENRDKLTLILAGGEIIHKLVPQEEAGEPTRVPMTEEEVLAALPENLRDHVAVNHWSWQPISHYTIRMCSELTSLAATQIKEGAKGVVVTCGTQALTEIAYYADLVWNFPQPLIFTASIFNYNLAGSETVLHLSQSLRAASSEICWGQGVLVCLQDALYSPRDLVQISNFSRSGFTSAPCGPLFLFSEPLGDLRPLRTPRRSKVLDINTVPARAIELLNASLGGGDLILKAIIETLDTECKELEGLVVAGFGDGDVPPSWVRLLKAILQKDIPVVLASRCPTGRVQSTADFQGSAAKLLEHGLINAGMLSPLQARMRLALALGAGLEDDDLRNYMQAE